MEPHDYYYLAKRNLLPDAETRIRVKGIIKKNSRIHISAVCGKAMASIACMLKEVGYVVTGSDSSFHPPMSDVLKSHGIECLAPSINNLSDIDLFVPGNMLPSSDTEVTFAREKGIPMMSGAEVCTQLLTKGRRSLVVCGTHGKTTSSSLLTHIFSIAGKVPAYLIGGVFQDSGKSYDSGNSKTQHAIFEGDEYDCSYFDKAPKFLRYSPTSVIITSIEHDHIDLYPTFEDYKQAFQFLIDDLPKEGNLIIHESALSHVSLVECPAQVYVYGSSEVAHFKYVVEATHEGGTIFSIHVKDGEVYSALNVPLFGEYNIANATAVCALGLRESLTIEEIIPGLRSYPGVQERQEILGTKDNSIIVIRDYAHHPTAVSVTLEGMRAHYPNRRIVCVFEPRSVTSRRKIFENEYPKALAHADVSVIVTPPFKENDNRNNFMDVSVVQKALESSHKTVYTSADPAEALQVLTTITKPNDVVIFMSNGDFGGIPHTFLDL